MPFKFKFKSGNNNNSVTRNYAEKGRYIPQALYIKLKKKKICGECGRKRYNGEIFEIHHIVAVVDGGTSVANNLRVCCSKCHEKLDVEQLRIRLEKKQQNNKNLEINKLNEGINDDI